MADPSVVNADTPSKPGYGQAILLFGIAWLLVLASFSAQSVAPRLGLAMTLIVCILLPAIIFIRLKGLPIAEALRLRRLGPSLLITSLLAGVGGWGIAVSLALLLKKLGMPSIPVSAFAADSNPALLLTFLVGAVLPGFCEECLFRGAIQGVLERRGRWFAIIVAGVLFGVLHMDPMRVPIASLLGIFVGWLVVRSGSLLPAILAHFGNNAMAIYAANFIEGFDEHAYWLLGSLSVLCVVATFVFFLLTNSRDFQASVKPSPLVDVPAGVSPAVAWGCGIPGVLGGGLFLALVAVLNVLITAAKVDDDALAPTVRSGDQLLLWRTESPMFEPKADAVVVFKQGDSTLARRVTRHESDRIWVAEPDGSETEVAISDIVGLLLQAIPSQTE